MDIRKLLNQSLKTVFQKSDESRQNNNRKEKRFRSAFTTDQIKYLEMQFKRSRYIGIVNRKEVAKNLNISERAIKIWFQNRRMKEKNDTSKEYSHYDHTGSRKVKFDDQPIHLDVFQTNNDPCLHSTLPQTKPRTSSVDNFVKNNYKPVPNKVTNTETENDSDDVVITSPYFQNNNVTSAQVGTTGEFSIDLLKRYKNHLHSEPSTKSQINVQTRKKEIGNCKPKETIKVRRESCQSSVPVVTSTAPEQHQPRRTCTQMRAGYVPLFPQNHYQPAACLPARNILWKPLDTPEMTSFMPVRDFAIVPHPQSVPYPVPQKHNVQRTKCFCNCHMLHVPHPATTAAFTQENQISQAQYVIAVPFHKSPIQFASPVYKQC